MLTSFLRQMWLNIMYELCHVFSLNLKNLSLLVLLFEFLFVSIFNYSPALSGVDLTL